MQMVISSMQQDMTWGAFLQFHPHVLFQSWLLMVAQWVLLWLPPIVLGGFGSSLYPQTIETTITTSYGAIIIIIWARNLLYKRGGRLRAVCCLHTLFTYGVLVGAVGCFHTTHYHKVETIGFFASGVDFLLKGDMLVHGR